MASASEQASVDRRRRFERQYYAFLGKFIGKVLDEDRAEGREPSIEGVAEFLEMVGHSAKVTQMLTAMELRIELAARDYKERQRQLGVEVEMEEEGAVQQPEDQPDIRSEEEELPSESQQSDEVLIISETRAADHVTIPFKQIRCKSCKHAEFVRSRDWRTGYCWSCKWQLKHVRPPAKKCITPVREGEPACEHCTKCFPKFVGSRCWECFTQYVLRRQTSIQNATFVGKPAKREVIEDIDAGRFPQAPQMEEVITEPDVFPDVQVELVPQQPVNEIAKKKNGSKRLNNSLSTSAPTNRGKRSGKSNEASPTKPMNSGAFGSSQSNTATTSRKNRKKGKLSAPGEVSSSDCSPETSPTKRARRQAAENARANLAAAVAEGKKTDRMLSRMAPVPVKAWTRASLGPLAETDSPTVIDLDTTSAESPTSNVDNALEKLDEYTSVVGTANAAPQQSMNVDEAPQQVAASPRLSESSESVGEPPAEKVRLTFAQRFKLETDVVNSSTVIESQEPQSTPSNHLGNNRPVRSFALVRPPNYCPPNYLMIAKNQARQSLQRMDSTVKSFTLVKPLRPSQITWKMMLKSPQFRPPTVNGANFTTQAPDAPEPSTQNYVPQRSANAPNTLFNAPNPLLQHKPSSKFILRPPPK